MTEYGEKWLYPHLADEITRDVAEWRKQQSQLRLARDQKHLENVANAIAEAERIMGYGESGVDV